MLADLSALRVRGLSLRSTRRGPGASTSNHYLTAAKGFTRWLVKDRRVADDVLAHLSRINAKADVRRERRTLDAGDFGKLLAAAEAGPLRYGLSGPDRVLLYRTAAYTGLRASELASLSERSFNLAADPPTVTVEAGYSKRRRRDVLPVHPQLAADLHGWFDSRSAATMATLRIDGSACDVRLWPGAWASYAASIIRSDLEAAGVPYGDDAGRVFDFHALRHQFISMLAAAGVHPKEAQELARHSDINLTLSRYTHVGLRDTAAAVGRLPSIATPQAAKATGTAGIGTGFGCTDGCTDACQNPVAADDSCGNDHARTGRCSSSDQGRKPCKNTALADESGPLMTAEVTAQGESRTPTGVTPQRILNPSRLPFRHPGFRCSSQRSERAVASEPRSIQVICYDSYFCTGFGATSSFAGGGFGAASDDQRSNWAFARPAAVVCGQRVRTSR